MDTRIKAVVDWLIRGRDGKVHIAQFPNLPIIGWGMFLIASQIVASHAFKAGFGSISTGFLAIWSYLEITQGSSRIRQILGIVVGAVLVYSCF
jgi:hypothetical protein